MENVEGKEAHAQILKYTHTYTHMNSTQNDKTIFEIYLWLFVKDILVDIRNDTTEHIELNRL